MTGQEAQQIEALFRECAADLYNYANAIVKEPFLAEELVSEAFRIACQKPQSVFQYNPKGWLQRTVKNLIKQMYRQKAKDNQLIMGVLSELPVEPADPLSLENNVDVDTF